MTLPPIVTGIDRFIALRWADYALDLLIATNPAGDPYARLKIWLDQEISGKESSNKTARQIRRLWLDAEGKTQPLRIRALRSGIAEDAASRPVLHLGMAINVFPMFREVCGVVGRLTGLQGFCTRQETCRRVMEKYGNPASIPRVVDRVFQTLIDWQLMEKSGKVYRTRPIRIEISSLAGWFLEALLFSQSDQQLALADLQTMPERLGIRVMSEREVIRTNPNLYIIRDGTIVERIGLMVE